MPSAELSELVSVYLFTGLKKRLQRQPMLRIKEEGKEGENVAKYKPPNRRPSSFLPIK
jgi:hypothetical protein